MRHLKFKIFLLTTGFLLALTLIGLTLLQDSEKINDQPLIQRENTAEIIDAFQEPDNISKNIKNVKYQDWLKFSNNNWNYTFYHPEQWQKLAQDKVGGSNTLDKQRIIFKSTDDAVFLSIYAYNKSPNQSLPEWFQLHQRAFFYDYVNLVNKPNAIINEKESLIINKCPNQVFQTAFIDAHDKILYFWITGTHEDTFRQLLNSLTFNNKPGSVELIDDTLVYQDSACDQQPESTSLPSDKTCSYDNSQTSHCCSQFTDVTVDYWNCSKNSSGSYGNCVWWAAYKRPDVGKAAAYHPGQGDAGNWDYWAHSMGYLIDDCPRVGDIYVDDTNKNRSGHVAFVEKYNDNGTIDASSMGWCYKCLYYSSYSTTGKKFIHSQKDEIVFYWDRPNEIAQELNVPGSCGGRTNIWSSEAGLQNLPDWFIDQASAILIPDGWSVKLHSEKDGLGQSICLNKSQSNLIDNKFEGVNFTVDNDVESFEVFFDRDCVN